MLKFPSPLSTFSQGSWIHAIYRTSVSFSVKTYILLTWGETALKMNVYFKIQVAFSYIYLRTYSLQRQLEHEHLSQLNNVESTINEHVDTLQKTGFLQICAFLFSYSFIHGNDAQYGFSFIFHESV